MSKIIGIDLGTTFSAIAELDDLGNPEVLSDPENNNRITRSAVYIGRDKAIVGDKAVDAAVTSKKNTILEVKSKMEDNVVWSSKEGDWIEKEGKKDRRKQKGQKQEEQKQRVKQYKKKQQIKKKDKKTKKY